jgi:hypothetical protein
MGMKSGGQYEGPWISFIYVIHPLSTDQLTALSVVREKIFVHLPPPPPPPLLNNWLYFYFSKSLRSEEFSATELFKNVENRSKTWFKITIWGRGGGRN